MWVSAGWVPCIVLLPPNRGRPGRAPAPHRLVNARAQTRALLPRLPQDLYCVAHEMGHCFGAPHTQDTCGLGGVAGTIGAAPAWSEAGLGRPTAAAQPVHGNHRSPRSITCAPADNCGRTGAGCAQAQVGVLPTCSSARPHFGGAGLLMSYCHELDPGAYSNIVRGARAALTALRAAHAALLRLVLPLPSAPLPDCAACRARRLHRA